MSVRNVKPRFCIKRGEALVCVLPAVNILKSTVLAKVASNMLHVGGVWGSDF